MFSTTMRLRKVFGQDSWRLASDRVEAFITRLGGHLGPVTFSLPNGKIQPFAVAPWAEEALGPEVPAVLKVLRGDFFCCPFGGNARPWRTERLRRSRKKRQHPNLLVGPGAWQRQ